MTLNGTALSSTTTSDTFAEANGSYAYTVGGIPGYSASPASGTVSVTGAPVNVSVTFSPLPATAYAVYFNESSLPSGTNWSVTFNGTTTASTSSTIGFTAPNGSYSFTVATASGWAPSPSSGTVTVSGASVAQGIAFTAPPPSQYTVTFSETGLPSSTSWSVTLNGSTQTSSSGSVTFNETNGTYAFSIPRASGYDPNSPTGNVSVAGSAVSVPITFTKAPQTTYTITVQETGLPSGTRWWATLNGSIVASTTSQITYTEPNGSYRWSVAKISGYTQNVTHGVTVVSGSGPTISVGYHRTGATLYPVTFVESGLPSGLPWTVTLNGSLGLSVGSQVSFNESNGSYSFAVGSIPGYSATPSSGTTPVSGHAVTVDISFAAKTFPVTFQESGLTAGTLWGVTVGGTLHSTDHSSLTFSEPNGTYAFTVSSVTGYSAAPSSGNVTVVGAPATASIAFVPPQDYSVAFTETGLPAGTTWGVTLGSTFVNTSTNALFFGEPNGSFAFVVSTPSGFNATPASGQIVVSGANAATAITFAGGSTGGGPTYPVRFNETGLPSNVTWGVQVNGSTQSTRGGANLTFNLTNGTYPFLVGAVPGFTAVPDGGNISVDAAGVNVSLAFAPTGQSASFLVQFVESGLPSGTVWGVTFDGIANSSGSASVAFTSANGTFAYSIHRVDGYVSSISSGWVNVNGSEKSVDVNFTSKGGSPTPLPGSGGLSITQWTILIAVAIVIIGLIAIGLASRGTEQRPSTEGGSNAPGSTEPPLGPAPPRGWQAAETPSSNPNPGSIPPRRPGEPTQS